MKFRVRLILCAIAFALAISVKQMLPQAKQQIKALLFGKGGDPVTQAVIALRDSLKSGDNLKKCVYAFYEELHEED